MVFDVGCFFCSILLILFFLFCGPEAYDYRHNLSIKEYSSTLEKLDIVFMNANKYLIGPPKRKHLWGMIGDRSVLFSM